MLERRGFLRGLVSLPLIGGGVTLLGRPTASAVPVTDELLRRYGAFCWVELNKTTRILKEMHGPGFDWNDFGREFIEPQIAACGPRENAAVVLSTVGVPLWRER